MKIEDVDLQKTKKIRLDRNLLVNNKDEEEDGEK